MKEKLISIEEIQTKVPKLRGGFGKMIIKLAMSLTGLNKVNKIYDTSKHLEGPEFCHHLLQTAGINIVVENLEVINQFEGQPFITVSNHAYGHIDGIAAIDILATQRPDYKMMVNFILGMIDTMAMNFIVVNPYESGKLANKSSFEGVKQSIEHLKNGHALGFFPAGAVSKTKVRGGKMEVEDREWQSSVIKLIQRAKVPVIPMYFSGKNSWLFNFLDLVNWRLRSLRLGHEVNNKKGKTIHVRLGEPIMPEEQAQYKTVKDLGKFLKDKTYALAKDSDKM